MEFSQPTSVEQAIQSGVASGANRRPTSMQSDQIDVRLASGLVGKILSAKNNSNQIENTQLTDVLLNKGIDTDGLYQFFLQATESAAKLAELAHQANLFNEMLQLRSGSGHSGGPSQYSVFTPIAKKQESAKRAANMVSGMSEEGSSDTAEAGETATTVNDANTQQGPAGDRSFSSPASESGPGNLLPNDRMDTQAPTPEDSQDPSTPNADTPVEDQPTEGETNETADPSGADQTLNPDGTSENDTETQPDEAPNEQGSTAPASEQPPVNAEASGAVSGTNPEDERERSNELDRQRNAARQGQGDGNSKKGEQQEGEGEAKSDDFKLKHEYFIIALTIIKELADFLDIIPFVGWALSYLVDFFASSGLFYLYATQSKSYIKNVLVANFGLIVLTVILELFPYIGALPLVATLKLYLDKRSKDLANQFAKTQKKAEKTRANIFKRRNKKQA